MALTREHKARERLGDALLSFQRKVVDSDELSLALRSITLPLA